jgi:hypothetical protein
MESLCLTLYCRVKWLAYVGIATWDEDNNQGGKRLGVPTAIRTKSKTGPLLDFGSTIKDVMQNGDEIYVSTSLNPEETK